MFDWCTDFQLKKSEILSLMSFWIWESFCAGLTSVRTVYWDYTCLSFLLCSLWIWLQGCISWRGMHRCERAPYGWVDSAGAGRARQHENRAHLASYWHSRWGRSFWEWGGGAHLQDLLWKCRNLRPRKSCTSLCVSRIGSVHSHWVPETVAHELGESYNTALSHLQTGLRWTCRHRGEQQRAKRDCFENACSRLLMFLICVQ